MRPIATNLTEVLLVSWTSTPPPITEGETFIDRAEKTMEQSGESSRKLEEAIQLHGGINSRPEKGPASR